MLEQCKSVKERWGGVHQLIDRWIELRYDMLVCLLDLREACDADLKSVSKARIDNFSELLMDYASAGHLEIYPQLKEEALAFEDHQALAVSETLLERMQDSTQLILRFDEDFSTPARCQHYLDRLPEWLNTLCDSLVGRFDLEDQLIERLHAAHAPKARMAESP